MALTSAATAGVRQSLQTPPWLRRAFGGKVGFVWGFNGFFGVLGFWGFNGKWGFGV